MKRNESKDSKKKTSTKRQNSYNEVESPQKDIKTTTIRKTLKTHTRRQISHREAESPQKP